MGVWGKTSDSFVAYIYKRTIYNTNIIKDIDDENAQWSSTREFCVDASANTPISIVQISNLALRVRGNQTK